MAARRASLGSWVAACAVAVSTLATVAAESLPSEVAMRVGEARYLEVQAALADLVPPAAPAPRSDLARIKGFAIAETDLRVALFRVARPELAADHAMLLRAQGPRGATALAVTSGIAPVSALLAAARAEFPGWVGPQGLRVAVVVAPGATLTLRPGERLQLDRTAGAFVLNFGTLDLSGGTVAGTGEPNPAAAAFAPFVLTAGQGVLRARGVHFADLGFGDRPIFGGVAVVANSLFGQALSSFLYDSTLLRVGSVLFSGAGIVDVTGNRFVDPRQTALILESTDGARIVDNLFFGGTGGDAIQLRDRATGTRIAGAEILRPKKSGVVLEAGSHRTTLRDVAIWRPGHKGIDVDRSECLSMAGLRVLGARRAAVVLAGSRGTTLADSMLVGAQDAGLWISDLPEDAVTSVTGTRFGLNRVGIETAAPGAVALRGNDFRDQFPRFLGGDVQPLTPRLLSDLMNAAPLVLAAGGTIRPLAQAPACLGHKER
ncbi:hypothetical protein DXV76_15115 [Rhodobacteraceae bacterium CCMM004]|nr:hypothetical protein DXV76_15115 [Rhodobacteraceae bacterium CCMM004]